ncbi:MAG: hypothetical protein JKX73_06750 [Flavobacteriales bacterium]|nr:hypothetical protein [Flavobacteriales bacterium]
MAILLTASFSYGQQVEGFISWQKSFGNSQLDRLADIKVHPTGEVVVVGNFENSEFRIFKLDVNGNMLWSTNHVTNSSGDTFAKSVEFSQSNGYYVGGSRASALNAFVCNSPTFPSSWDNHVAKFDSLGDSLWTTCLNSSISNEWVNSLYGTNDGGIITGSVWYTTSTLSYTWVIRKLDSLGDIEWSALPALPAGTDQMDIQIRPLPAGGYVAAGTAIDAVFGIPGWDVLLLKINDTGTVVSLNTYGGTSSDNCVSMDLLPNGGVVMMGNTYSSDGDVSSNHGMDDIWVLCVDSSGNILWEQTYGGSRDEDAGKISVTSDGGFIFTGSTKSKDGDVRPFIGPENIWVVKLDSIGNIVWSDTYGGTAIDEGVDIEEFSPGEYILGATIISNDGDVALNNGNRDGWVVKIKEVVPNKIQGSLFRDSNSDCVQNIGEDGIPDIIIRVRSSATNLEYYDVSDSLGNYSISVDSGAYIITALIPQSHVLLMNQSCPTFPSYYTILFDTLAVDSTGVDFAFQVLDCPLLTVDISSNRRRRCFKNLTTVKHCNEGFADTSNVFIYVELPEYLNLISANVPYSVDTSSGYYIFFIDSMAQGECGEIRIIDSVSCLIGITGRMQCVKAWTTPGNECVRAADTTGNWDSSLVVVRAVGCLFDSIVEFYILNEGVGDMVDSLNYRIYADGLLGFTGKFKLISQEEIMLYVRATGGTMRIEADQNQDYPGLSAPNASIEACGFDSITASLWNGPPSDDEEPEKEEDCMMIIDSYDPNMKRVSPEGITPNKFVAHGTLLDYTIHFQNTGSDTAYVVWVIDTLSQYVNLQTIQLGTSSHSYDLTITNEDGQRPVLTFKFEGIN